MKNIGLVGFGKIGQALAAQILDCGHRVTAVDSDAALSADLKAGDFTSPEPGVADSIRPAFAEGRLLISTEPSLLRECASVIVCIPLMVRDTQDGFGTIDFLPFDACFQALASVVHDGMLITLETTVPVGTCRNRLVSIFALAGKVYGRDYQLAFSPERVMSNTMRKQLVTNPKIVAGLTEEALAAAVDLYKSFLPPELIEAVSSMEVAEMIKLTAMVSRDVNIGLINQLSVFCDTAKVDVREVLKHVNSDQVSNLLSPGIGVGGHCTPVYPYFLIENFSAANLTFSLAMEARKINDSMVEYVANGVCEEFSLKTVLILGLGFRPNVKEDACSPAYQLNQILIHKGIQALIHDPLYTEDELKSKGWASVPNLYSTAVDAVFLVTMHDQFVDLDFSKLAELGCKIIVDGRNVFDQKKVVDSGIAYRGMGTGYFRSNRSSDCAEEVVIGGEVNSSEALTWARRSSFFAKLQNE